MDIARFVLYAKYHNCRFAKFREFLSAHLSVDHTCRSTAELRGIALKYDRIVCGSDQIWNYQITNFDKNYFLDFCDDRRKKIAYAASFGFDSLPPRYVEEYRTLLNTFNCISVREWQGRNIVRDLTQREAEVVLDPTMLLARSDWENVAQDYKNNNYIFVYAFGRLTPAMKTLLRKLSARTGCAIVYNSYTITRPIKATYEKCVGPAQFLGMFKNARYVVTNSFHGTAFSIIFNKDFFLEMLPVAQGINSRLENILDVFDLRSRLIGNRTEVNINEAIDYDRVNHILRAEREKSMSYIKRSIEI